jgi:hypothetical protein
MASTPGDRIRRSTAPMCGIDVGKVVLPFAWTLASAFAYEVMRPTVITR